MTTSFLPSLCGRLFGWLSTRACRRGPGMLAGNYLLAEMTRYFISMWGCFRKTYAICRDLIFGYGPTLNRQIWTAGLVLGFIYRGSPFWYPLLSHSHFTKCSLVKRVALVGNTHALQMGSGAWRLVRMFGPVFLLPSPSLIIGLFKCHGCQLHPGGLPREQEQWPGASHSSS